MSKRLYLVFPFGGLKNVPVFGNCMWLCGWS